MGEAVSLDQVVEPHAFPGGVEVDGERIDLGSSVHLVGSPPSVGVNPIAHVPLADKGLGHERQIAVEQREDVAERGAQSAATKSVVERPVSMRNSIEHLAVHPRGGEPLDLLGAPSDDVDDRKLRSTAVGRRARAANDLDAVDPVERDSIQERSHHVQEILQLVTVQEDEDAAFGTPQAADPGKDGAVAIDAELEARNQMKHVHQITRARALDLFPRQDGDDRRRVLDALGHALGGHGGLDVEQTVERDLAEVGRFAEGGGGFLNDPGGLRLGRAAGRR